VKIPELAKCLSLFILSVLKAIYLSFKAYFRGSSSRGSTSVPICMFNPEVGDQLQELRKCPKCAFSCPPRNFYEFKRHRCGVFSFINEVPQGGPAQVSSRGVPSEPSREEIEIEDHGI